MSFTKNLQIFLLIIIPLATIVFVVGNYANNHRFKSDGSLHNATQNISAMNHFQ